MNSLSSQMEVILKYIVGFCNVAVASLKTEIFGKDPAHNALIISVPRLTTVLLLVQKNCNTSPTRTLKIGSIIICTSHDKVAHNLLPLYGCFPQGSVETVYRPTAFIATWCHKVSSPSYFTYCRLTKHADRRSKSRQPVSCQPANANITCRTLSLPLWPGIWISRYFRKRLRWQTTSF